MTHAISTVAAAALLFASSAALPVSASELQDAYHAHQKLCLHLLFSDKAAHTGQCLPNTSPNIPAHAGSSDSGAAPGPAGPAAAPAAVPVDDSLKG